ncbi:putative RNA-directed DNA polymerase [Tanacetum coccineum]|uniref:RNA-directed DNA polymerase n=1 Tax=Tanacetum coccineum TaxID=301880 RepID=A0ABQ5BK91_9ASTR
MHGDETPDAYLNHAQEYADALATIGEPVKDKDLVMLVVSGLREEYNGLKTTIAARQSATASGELYALLSDHDYMLGKTRAPAPSITSSFVANYAVGSPSMLESYSGANSHVTPDLEAMDNSEAYYGDDALHVGNGKGLPVLHIGLSKVYSPQKKFSLKNILHVPEISHNLLSVQKFCHDNDVFFEFHTSYFVVKDESTHTTLLTGPSKHGLYTITLPQLKSINKVSFSAVRASPTIWHRRLGHPHQRLLHSMLSNFSLPVTNKSLSSFCNSCPLGKSSKLPLFESGFRSNNILDLVYCDVWGPAPLLSFEGHRYFMLCVDHHSRYMWIYHLAQKSDVYSTFKSFVQMVERQFTTKLKNVQTDWGGEFRNLASFFSSLGIIHRRSCPHTSEQNGFVERRNRHVVETGLTLLAQACVPQRFWHYAFDTAVYLINRMPSRTSTNKSPFEHIFKRSPDYSFLRVFGCLCFPYLRPYNHHKIDFRSTSCVFLGYSPSYHGYRCLDISTEHLYIARHVRFNEAQFPFDIPKTTSSPPSKTSPYYSSESPYIIPTTDHPSPSSLSVSHLSPTSQTSPESSNSQPSPVSTTSIPKPPPPPPPSTRQRPANLRQNPKQVSYNVPQIMLPSSPLPSLNQPRLPLLTTLWSGAKLKRDKNGAITRYKARFVAKGFRQQRGIEFHETYCPVVKSTTIRAVLSLAVTNNSSLRQLDVQNAFFHRNLKEQVYMKQPSGFIDPQRPIHKSLYDLKQPHTLGNPDTFLEAFSDDAGLEIQMIDAEYKALADTVAELTWLQALLNELGIRSSSTPILWRDNLGATYFFAPAVHTIELVEFSELINVLAIKFQKDDTEPYLKRFAFYVSPISESVKGFLKSPKFGYVTVFVLLLNLAAVIAETTVDIQNISGHKSWQKVEFVFAWIYLFEVVLHVYTYGFENYWDNSENRYNFILTWIIDELEIFLCPSVEFMEK